MTNYKFSGHETFPLRYAWLPKAYSALKENPKAFDDEENAMVVLGVGKNMVRAIRFWVHATYIAQSDISKGLLITNFGDAIFAGNGFDPFLEDVRTLWLIHWNLSTNMENPLFAWDYMLNRWQNIEFSRTSVLNSFFKESNRIGRDLSRVTLLQHFDVFLHTYFPTKSKKGNIQEDNLDSPLVELEMIQKIGERKIDNSGKREDVFSFRKEEKPEITPEQFVYFINDYWIKFHPNEKTLTFRDITLGHGSPGQLLKLSEHDIRRRLETLNQDSKGIFDYRESASIQQITKKQESHDNLLQYIYEPEVVNA
ncbi:MAG: DUF4007 family protein [bacterium]